MRILHVVPTYLPAWRHGGPVFAVHGLCAALAARGHQVTVFTTDAHGDGTLGPEVPRAAPVALDGVTVWYFPRGAGRRLDRSPAMGAALARALPAAGQREGGSRGGGPAFDVVHLHSVFLWPTAAAARAARRAGVPYVLAPRGMLVDDLLRRRGRWRKRLWIALVERRNVERAAALHATSQLEADEVARLGLRPRAVWVVANGVAAVPDPGAAAPLAPAVAAALGRRPLLLYLGRVSWKKGLDRLFQALSRVPGAVLAVAGNDEEGYRRELDPVAAAAGVADRVLWLGPVAGADKAALLHRADALVLPSYSENFGNVVLEAMAAGLPVAVTPEVGLAPLVRQSGAGVVTPGDIAGLAAALAALLTDPAARRDMGRRGAAAAQQYAWPAIAARMEKLYRSVLATPRAGGEPAAADGGAAAGGDGAAGMGVDGAAGVGRAAGREGGG
jgi:glycosyltransferase involved in cell wall biosynthesis